MPPSLTEILRRANHELGIDLSHLDAACSPVTADLPRLLKEISRASEALEAASPASFGDLELQQELSLYHDQLEQLRQVLPAFHMRLQLEKIRLRTALDHLHSVTAWAHSNHP